MCLSFKFRSLDQYIMRLVFRFTSYSYEHDCYLSFVSYEKDFEFCRSLINDIKKNNYAIRKQNIIFSFVNHSLSNFENDICEKGEG